MTQDSCKQADELADRLRAVIGGNPSLAPLLAMLMDQLESVASGISSNQVAETLYMYEAVNRRPVSADIIDEELIPLYRECSYIINMYILLASIPGLDVVGDDADAMKLDPPDDSQNPSAGPMGDASEVAQEFSLIHGTFYPVAGFSDTLYYGHLKYPENQSVPCMLHSLPSGTYDLARRRFAQEAMIGMEVSRGHESLLTTLDFGRSRDGRLFIAHELVKGRAISEQWDLLRGDYDTIRHIADATLSALTFMHAHGVSHGAVEATNLLLGETGAVRLGNFSMARRNSGRGARHLDRSSLSALILSLVIGSPLERVPPDQVAERIPRDTPDDIRQTIMDLALS